MFSQKCRERANEGGRASACLSSSHARKVPLIEGLRGWVEAFQDTRHSARKHFLATCSPRLSRCLMPAVSLEAIHQRPQRSANVLFCVAGGVRVCPPSFFARRLFAETTFALARCAPNTPRLQQVRIKLKGERESDSGQRALCRNLLSSCKPCPYLQ